MRRLIAVGAQGFVEVGAGTVLRGLLRTIDKAVPSWNVDDPDGFQATLAALAGGAPAPGDEAPPAGESESLEEAG